MKGWLMPPVSGIYAFWIASDDGGDRSLSSDDHPENKVRECFVPSSTGVREWNKFQELKSPSIQLKAGEAYYFEVSPAIIFAALHFACSTPLQKLSYVFCTLNNTLSIVCILIFLISLKALMKNGYGSDHMAIVWQIPGQESVEVIPAYLTTCQSRSKTINCICNSNI
jgi:hypothetical protein